MLTPEIRVNTANFLRKRTELRKGPNMSSRYMKRIVYFLIIGLVFVLVYCVFSTTRTPAATGWTGGVQNMHMAGNIQGNKAGKIQGNMEDNIEGNKAGNMEDNIEGNIQGNIIDNDAADGRRVHESVAINGHELAAVRQDDGENKAIEEGGNVVDNLKEPEQAVDDLGGNPVNIVRGHDTDNRANDEKPDIIGLNDRVREILRLRDQELNLRDGNGNKITLSNNNVGDKAIYPGNQAANQMFPSINIQDNVRNGNLFQLERPHQNQPEGMHDKNNNNVGDKAIYPVNQAANQMFPSNNIQDNVRNGNLFQLERNGNQFQLERPQQNQPEGMHDKGNNNVGDKAFFPGNQAANQMFPSNNIQDNARNGNPFQLERPLQNQLEGMRDKGNNNVGDKAFYPGNQAANQMFPSNNIQDNARNGNPFQPERPHQNQREGMHKKGKTLIKLQTFDEFLREKRKKGNLFQDPGAFQQPLGHVGVDNNAQNNFIPNNELVAPRDNMDANLPNKNVGESIDNLRKLNPFFPGHVNKPEEPNPWHNEFRHLNPFFREKLAQQHINPFVQNNPNLLGAKPLIPDFDKINLWENRLANNLQGANPIIPAGDKINDWENHLANRQNDPIVNGRQILQTGADDAGRVTAKPNMPTTDGDVQPPGERQPQLPEHGASDSKNDLEKHDTQEVTAAANPKVTCVDFRFPTGNGQLCMPAGDKAAGVSEKIQQDAANAAGVMDQILLILSNDTNLNFIDIGATIGLHSTAAALMSRYVLAIEPLKSNHQLLLRTAVKNQVYKRIKLLERALDSEPYVGVAKPAVAAESYGQVNVSRLWSGSQHSRVTDDANTVLVTTLNKLVPDVPFRRALVRLGFHGGIGDNFLEASDDFFREIIVTYIITHWPGSKSADVTTKMIATLDKFGFKPHMTWNGPEVTLNPLQMDYNYLVWKRV